MAWVGVRMSVWHYDGLCFKHSIANLIFNSRDNIGSNRVQRRPGLSQSSCALVGQADQGSLRVPVLLASNWLFAKTRAF